MGIQTWILIIVLSSGRHVVIPDYGSPAECTTAQEYVKQNVRQITIRDVFCFPGPVTIR